MAVLKGSVGLGGKNQPKDLLLVQKLLLDFGFSPPQLEFASNQKYNSPNSKDPHGLKLDFEFSAAGSAGHHRLDLVAAIRVFQRKFRFAPSGLIQPGSACETQLIGHNPIAAAVRSNPAWRTLINGGIRTRAAALRRGGLEMPMMIAARQAYYPPKPPFAQMSHATRAAVFGSFEFETDPDPKVDDVKITSKTAEYDIESFFIPQLARIPNSSGGYGAHGKVYCHRKAGPRFQALFAAWEEAGLLSRIDHYSGPLVRRYMRNVPHDGKASSLSNHSWGTAIDLNVPQNKLGYHPARLGEFGCVMELVPIAYELGFFWGGHFGAKRNDGMHFEIAQLPG